MPRAPGAATSSHDAAMRPEGLEPPRVAPQDPKSARPRAASDAIDGHQRERKELRRSPRRRQDRFRPMPSNAEEVSRRSGTSASAAVADSVFAPTRALPMRLTLNVVSGPVASETAAV